MVEWKNGQHLHCALVYSSLQRAEVLKLCDAGSVVRTSVLLGCVLQLESVLESFLHLEPVLHLGSVLQSVLHLGYVLHLWSVLQSVLHLESVLHWPARSAA